MKKDKKKTYKYDIHVDMNKTEKNHYVGQLPNVYFPY